MSNPNPYQSPQYPAFSESNSGLFLPVLPRERWSEVYLEVLSVERRWWKRRIFVTGSVHCDILYNAAGNGERLYLNGRLAATTSSFHWKIVFPYIDFFLEGLGHAVPARIDVAASIWRALQITTFQLTVAGQVVYQE